MKSPMQLRLADITSWQIAGPEGDRYKGRLPTRMKYVHPDVVSCLKRILVDGYWLLRISDMYRDPIASLMAYVEYLAGRKSGGVQRPGWSGHNYGISIDVDVEGILVSFRHANLVAPFGPSMPLPSTYPELLLWMAERGWSCHRRDGKRGPEDWHFNCWGEGRVLPPHGAAGAGLWIGDHHGSDFDLDETEAQTALQKLGLYHGDLDGDWGPLSKAALMAFERTYALPPDGRLDAIACRTLAIASATKELIVVSSPEKTS
jgi:hypothetical protein